MADDGKPSKALQRMAGMSDDAIREMALAELRRRGVSEERLQQLLASKRVVPRKSL